MPGVMGGARKTGECRTAPSCNLTLDHANSSADLAQQLAIAPQLPPESSDRTQEPTREWSRQS